MMKHLRSHQLSIGSMMALLVLIWQIATPLTTQAATFVWDSNTGTLQVQDGAGTWTSAGTTWWNPAGAGSNVAITSGDIGFFGAGGVGGAITLSGNQSLLGMIFGQTTTTGYSFTAGSATTLTLAGSGVTVLAGAQPVTIGDANLSLVLGAAQSWANRSTNALTIGGAVDNGGFGLTLGAPAGLPGTGSYTLNGALTGAGGLTLSGPGTTTITAASGYTGATLISNGSTLALSGAAGAITGTSGITLQRGTLAVTNAVGEHGVDRINNAAGITSYGGTISWSNPSGDNTANWAETLGVLSLQKGNTVVIAPNAVNGARTQSLTLGTGSLTHAAANTSTIAFAGATLGATTNRIFVTGASATAANQIIGPWATFGASAAAQTDYAIYNATTGIQARAVAASAETTWTTAGNTYTMGAAQTLTATRTINSIRNSGGALTLGLGASTFNLATFGILNGGTGALTVSTTGTGGVTTPTTGDNTLFLIAGNNAITVSAPIINNAAATPAVHVVKAGGSNVTLSGANTYTGVTTVNSGILVSGAGVAINFNGGAASSWLGSSDATAGNLVLNGGTLRYAGPTGGTTNRLFTLGEAGGTIENSAASNGTLAFTGTGAIVAAGTGDRTLTLNANGTGGFTFAPQIVDPSSGTTSLVINSTNSGAITLSNTSNNFTGGITIQARTLITTVAGGLGSNVVSFGTGTSPLLSLRNNTSMTFTGSLNVGDNSGTLQFGGTSNTDTKNHSFGAITIGSANLSFTQTGANSNRAHSLTSTGAVPH